MKNIAKVLMALAITGIWPRFCSATADENPGLLTSDEIAFLMKHAPEINQVVSSGAAVVYGNVIEPPILVTVNRDRVFLGGLQVLPNEARPTDYLARKRVNEIHLHWLTDKTRGVKNMAGSAESLAGEMRGRGKITSYAFLKDRPNPKIEVRVGDERAGWAVDTCYSPQSDKFDFIIRTIFRAYSLRKEADGKEKALTWLHYRFEDFKVMGMLASFDFDDEEELVRIRYGCALLEHNYGFYGPRSERGVAYEKHWKSVEDQTKASLDEIIARLRVGKIIVHSYGSDKHIDNSNAFRALVQQLRGDSPDKSAEHRLQNEFGYSSEEARQFLEEVR